jgi:corrinoid protein of di/trimethylamine methyltransferase
VTHVTDLGRRSHFQSQHEVIVHEKLLCALRQCVIDGAADTALALAHDALAASVPPLEAIHHGLAPGMAYVGEQFARRAMFLPDMMASAEAMKAAMSVLDPELKRRGTERSSSGKVILGTTKGDIHEIGKTLVGTLLTANGFTVLDLGVDVAPERFAATAQESQADIVGVSALLTTTMRGQKSVVEALDRAGLRERVKIMVGGAPVTRQWAQEIGADGYASDAVGAVTLARELIGQLRPDVQVRAGGV